MISQTANKIKGSSAHGVVYLKGNKYIDESIRLSIDPDTNFTEIEKLIDGIWQPTSFETGANSLWVGHNVGVAGMGHHLATESVDGHFHFHAHSEFDSESGLSSVDAQVINAYGVDADVVYQADDTGLFTGTDFSFTMASPAHILVKSLKYKTGPIAATNSIDVKIYKGTNNKGTLIFHQKYPASDWPANTAITLPYIGCVEYDKDQDYFVEYSSDSDFSFKTDASKTYPWFSGDTIYVREDNLLQTKSWAGGDNWNGSEYCIQDRKIYICNVTGVQNGTFEDNSDKWDELSSHLTTETDPVFSASPAAGILPQDILNWDEAYGWGDHAQAGYLTEESDPIFSAWDKSSGISITESQISDLQNYLLTETDPIFTAWDRSEGISITESQISDLSHTPVFDGDIAEIFNSAGLFKIQPDAQGDVELFGDTDVDNSENGKILKIWRKAPEGNTYLRFYISASGTAFLHGSGDLTLQAQQPFTINSITDDINFRVGDSAGAKKVYFKNSDGDILMDIASNGLLRLDANNGGALLVVRGSNNNIKTVLDSTNTDIRFGGQKEYNRIGTWIDKPFQIVTNSVERIIIDQYGRVEIPSSLTVGDLEATDDILAYKDVAARNLISRGIHGFQDYSTQEEASVRNHSHGHTHTAIYNDDWYDTDSDGMASRDMHFSPDGLMMYIIGIAGGGIGDCSIWEYPLTIPWDLSTVGTPTIESIETYGSNQTGLYIDRDGRRLWTVCSSNDTIIEYAMSPWDISRLSWVQAKDISGQDTAPSSIFWSSQGNRVYVAGDSDNDIIAFSVTNEWDISGLSWFENFGTNIDAPTGLHFSSDGRRMYVMDGSAEDDIHEYHLSSPWMISSARLVNLFNVSAENSSPQGIFIAPDNAKIFMVGTSTPDGVYSYDLGSEVKGKIVGGTFKAENMPTSDPTETGVLWNDSGNVRVSAG